MPRLVAKFIRAFKSPTDLQGLDVAFANLCEACLQIFDSVVRYAAAIQVPDKTEGRGPQVKETIPEVHVVTEGPIPFHRAQCCSVPFLALNTWYYPSLHDDQTVSEAVHVQIKHHSPNRRCHPNTYIRTLLTRSVSTFLF